MERKKANLVEIHKLPGPSKKRLKFGCGRKLMVITMENQLMEEIALERQQQHHVSSNLIQV